MATVATDPGQTPQRMEALGRGNQIRIQRAALKRRIRAAGRPGAAIAARLLTANTEIIRDMDVGELLLWVRHFGKEEARKLLYARRIDPWCPVDELSENKRRHLAGDLVAFSEGGSRRVLRVRA